MYPKSFIFCCLLILLSETFANQASPERFRRQNDVSYPKLAAAKGVLSDPFSNENRVNSQEFSEDPASWNQYGQNYDGYQQDASNKFLSQNDNFNSGEYRDTMSGEYQKKKRETGTEIQNS